MTFNNRFMRADAISLTLYTTVFYNPTVLLSLLESLCLVKSSLDFVRKYLFECVFNSLCFLCHLARFGLAVTTLYADVKLALPFVEPGYYAPIAYSWVSIRCYDHQWLK